MQSYVFLFIVNSVIAQEKYEYAIVRQFNREITFVSGENVESIIVREVVDAKIFQETILKLNSLSPEWEVYNSTEVIINQLKGYTYFLRRKVESKKQ